MLQVARRCLKDDASPPQPQPPRCRGTVQCSPRPRAQSPPHAPSPSADLSKQKTRHSTSPPFRAATKRRGDSRHEGSTGSSPAQTCAPASFLGAVAAAHRNKTRAHPARFSATRLQAASAAAGDGPRATPHLSPHHLVLLNECSVLLNS